MVDSLLIMLINHHRDSGHIDSQAAIYGANLPHHGLTLTAEGVAASRRCGTGRHVTRTTGTSSGRGGFTTISLTLSLYVFLCRHSRLHLYIGWTCCSCGGGQWQSTNLTAWTMMKAAVLRTCAAFWGFWSICCLRVSIQGCHISVVQHVDVLAGTQTEVLGGVVAKHYTRDWTIQSSYTEVHWIYMLCFIQYSQHFWG